MWKVPASEAPNIIARFRHTDDIGEHKPLRIPTSEATLVQQELASLKRAVEQPEAFSTRKQRSELVQRVYRLSDQMMGYVEQSIGLACTKSCSYCCSLDVEVTRVELDRLADVLPRKPLTKRAKKSKARTYCPFLDTNTATCTIYADRPYSCRTFAVYDHPAYCRDPNASHGVTAQNGQFVSPVLYELMIILLKMRPTLPRLLTTVYGHGPAYEPIIAKEQNLPFTADWHELRPSSKSTT